MKKIYSFAATAMLLLATHAGRAQTLVYTYGKNGGVTQRSVKGNALRMMSPFKKDSLPKQLDFNVYPNPATGYITIEGTLPDNVTQAKVSVVNLGGQVLKTDTYTGQPKTLSVSDLKPGAYLLEFAYSKDRKSTYKIIITN